MSFCIDILTTCVLNADQVCDALWWNFVLFCEESLFEFRMLLS
jgi:hypothetical protein